MNNMQRIETSLPGVCLIEPTLFSDERGFFFESYHHGKFADLGIIDCFVQDNHSQSIKGTLRGVHYQLKYPQSKLCRVIQGEVLDVVVDIRRGSPTFAQWESAIVSAENKKQIYIPKGFAHGFLVLSETAEFLYKCDEFYHPEDEYGIVWDDLDLNIDWRMQSPKLSDKDRHLLPLAKIPLAHLPKYKVSNGCENTSHW